MNRSSSYLSEGATARGSIIPGEAGVLGYRYLEPGPGEPLQVRNEFGGSGASMRLRSLACFVQVSDLHVADVQSPARAEFLDRLGDPDSPCSTTYGRNRTYRAQEAFNHHVIESMAVAVRRLGGGPLTGSPVTFAISTGDATDNCQGNELENYLALLDGGRSVDPDSGDRARFEGVGAIDNYDVRYWHPDGTPDGESDDFARSRHGFPTIAGILDTCRTPFIGTGLGLPWYAVYGNHDALVGGIYPPTDALLNVVLGGQKPIYLDQEVDVADFLDGNEIGREFTNLTTLAMMNRQIERDSSRRFVGIRDWIAAHLQHTGFPHGHGFDQKSVDDERAYYAFDAGEIRCIVLDTVNRNGGWQGSIDDEQFRWLEEELLAGHGKFLDASGNNVVHDSKDRLFVLFSHHTIGDLTNRFDPQKRLRHDTASVAELLSRFPNVIGWFNGHTHENAVSAIRPRNSSRRGFWQVTSASHIDWPQQSRLIEIAVNDSTGDLVIATVCIDHAGMIDPRHGELDDPLTIAGWSRELALNAWQSRASRIEPAGRGKALDRNVALLMPAPFVVSVRS